MFQAAVKRHHVPADMAMKFLPNQCSPAEVKFKNAVTHNHPIDSGSSTGKIIASEMNTDNATHSRYLAPLSVTLPEMRGRSGLLIRSSSMPTIWLGGLKKYR